jgi:hypothetical protein
VLAQVEQQQARHRAWAWMPQTWSPAWASAVVVGLVLSLAVNVWWGAKAIRSTASDEYLHQQSLSTYRFQRGMQNAKALGTFVTARAAFGEQVVGLGFAPRDLRITFFRMGTLYTDALAALHSGALDVAAERVDALTKVLDHVQAPPALSHYLGEMQTLLPSRRYGGEELAKFLALFELLYEHEYAKPHEAGRVTLFQAGSWLENMYLAAAAGDKTSLKQGPTVQYFRRALTRLRAPHEVLEALNQLRHLIARQGMTDEDVQTILTLIQDVQQILGAMQE